MKKLLVQMQFQPWFDPNCNTSPFEFPQDQLKMPPLDECLKNTWTLPIDFVVQMVGDKTDRGSILKSDPLVLFS